MIDDVGYILMFLLRLDYWITTHGEPCVMLWPSKRKRDSDLQAATENNQQITDYITWRKNCLLW